MSGSRRKRSLSSLSMSKAVSSSSGRARDGRRERPGSSWRAARAVEAPELVLVDAGAIAAGARAAPADAVRARASGGLWVDDEGEQVLPLRPAVAVARRPAPSPPRPAAGHRGELVAEPRHSRRRLRSNSAISRERGRRRRLDHAQRLAAVGAGWPGRPRRRRRSRCRRSRRSSRARASAVFELAVGAGGADRDAGSAVQAGRGRAGVVLGAQHARSARRRAAPPARGAGRCRDARRGSRRGSGRAARTVPQRRPRGARGSIGRCRRRRPAARVQAQVRRCPPGRPPRSCRSACTRSSSVAAPPAGAAAGMHELAEVGERLRQAHAGAS